MAPARIVLLLIDGLGDVSVPALGHRTPLQVASTPTLDALAAAGCSGLLDPVAPGYACGSDTAHLSLLGYDPRGCYRGRGAFESLGAGLRMAAGDVAFKCNFATVDEATRTVTARRADRHFEEDGPLLCDALDNLQLPPLAAGAPAHVLSVRYATEHRAGAVLRGAALCDRVTGTDPLRDGLPLARSAPLDDSAEAAHTAAVVNQARHAARDVARDVALMRALQACDAVRSVLRAHPVNAARAAAGRAVANALLLRGPGERLREQSFLDRHGLRGAVVAPTKIIAGLALCLDMDVVEAPGATGDYRSDLAAKAEAMGNAMAPHSPYTFGMLHFKAADDAAHDRNIPYRVAYLAAADAMLAQLLRRLRQHELSEQGIADGIRYIICATGDHSTPVLFGDHSNEPVPIALAHVADVAAALCGDDVLVATPLVPIRTPEFPRHPADAADVASPADDVSSASASAAPLEPMAPPRAIAGDGVCAFDELAAAAGGLGRFCGAELMPLLKAFAATQPECGGRTHEQ